MSKQKEKFIEEVEKFIEEARLRGFSDSYELYERESMIFSETYLSQEQAEFFKKIQAGILSTEILADLENSLDTAFEE